MKKIVPVLLILSATLFAAKTKFVIVETDNLPLYKKQAWSDSDTPVTTVSRGEKLEVLKNRDDLYRVKTDDAETGWILKSSVSPAKESVQDGFTAQTVQSSNSAPTPGHVEGIDDTEPTDAIIPERSFKDNLKNNVDKESVGN